MSMPAADGHRRTFGASAFALLATVASFALLACAGDPAVSTWVTGGDPELGKVVISTMGCGACHVVPGVRGAIGKTGPPLTDFGRRQYIAGRLVNEPENLVAWILDPRAIDSATAMPTLGLNPTQARNAAAYLLTLGAGDDRPRHPLPASWLRALRGH